MTEPTLSQDLSKLGDYQALHAIDLSKHDEQIAALVGYIDVLKERVAGLEADFNRLEAYTNDHIIALEDALSKLHDIDNVPIFEPRGPHD